MGAAGIPGTTEAFNPITGEWKKYDLNQVGNTNGGSWHCVISRPVEEPGGDLRLPRLHGQQEERLLQRRQRLDRRAAGHEVRVSAAGRQRAPRRVQGARLERGRRDGVPEGLLCRDQRAVAAAISAHPRRRRILARARRQHLGGSRRADGAEGGARRHRGGLGEDHRPLRPRQAEGALRGFVRRKHTPNGSAPRRGADPSFACEGSGDGCGRGSTPGVRRRLQVRAACFLRSSG